MRAFLSALVWAASAAQAYPADQGYCVLWARERTRIELVTAEDTATRTASVETIIRMAEEFFEDCLVAETNNLKLPRTRATFTNGWAENMRSLLVSQAGTAPATDDYEAQCAAEYRTWDPETKTVIRYGSSERVPCPCGKEVSCD